MVVGMDAYDRTSGQHVLWSTTMPPEAAAQVEPLALRCVKAQTLTQGPEDYLSLRLTPTVLKLR